MFSTLQRKSAWGATLLLALYAGNYFLTPDIVGITQLEAFYRPRGHSEFNSERWKRNGSASKQRYEMVDQLVASRLLVGLHTGNVEQLLGKPDLVGNDQGRLRFLYFLGDQRTHPATSILFPCMFRNLDRWMLEIQIFDGKVLQAKVIFT